MTRAVSGGVLRAAVVVAALLLVAALAIALTVKRGSMEESADRCDELLLNGALGDDGESSLVLQHADALGECAEELRDEARGVLAGIAGDPGELDELAERAAEESVRLTELAALLE